MFSFVFKTILESILIITSILQMHRLTHRKVTYPGSDSQARVDGGFDPDVWVLESTPLIMTPQ